MSEEILLKARRGRDPLPDKTAEDLVQPPRAHRSAQEARFSQSVSPTRTLNLPLWQVRGWMKLLGVLFIINGIAMALSIWGIVVCWLPIWLGITLFSAASNAQTAAETDSQQHLQTALQKISLFFKINGIMAIIGIVVGLCIFAAVALGLAGSAALLGRGILPQ